MAVIITAEARTWSVRQGQTLEAEFVKVEKGLVWLQTVDGKQMSVSFNALIDEDQTLVKKLYEEGQEKAAAERAAREEVAAAAEKERHDAILAKWKPGQVSSHVTTNKTQTSYHVYIPTSFNPDTPPPLIYAFSPGGNGRGQLNAMKASAEKYGWIVVGCDKLSNSMKESAAIPIEDEIIAEVKASVPYDPKRIYLSGMSGGALRCYIITGRRTDIKFAGVLAFGGWLGGKDFQDKVGFTKGMSVAIINGDNDKGANCWVEADKAAIKKHRCNLKQFTFPGGHVMAPPEVINEAIEWIITQPLPK